MNTLENSHMLWKVGFTGVYIIFLVLAPKMDCGFPLEQPRDGSNQHLTIYAWSNKNRKKNTKTCTLAFDVSWWNSSVHDAKWHIEVHLRDVDKYTRRVWSKKKQHEK